MKKLVLTLKKVFRISNSIGVLSQFIGISIFFKLTNKNETTFRKKMLPWMSYFSKKLLNVFGFKLDIKGDLPEKHLILVANHLSYYDILILCSIQPCIFITSLEMKKTPILGWIVSLGGCLFVDRENPNNLKAELNELESQIQEKFNLGFFPEANSKDGFKVYQFKPALFQAAVSSQIPVIPVCINYKKIDNQPIDLNNKDKLFWHDDSSFPVHLWKGADFESVEVEIKILSEIPILTHNRKSLAQYAQDKISDHYCPPLPAMTQPA